MTASERFFFRQNRIIQAGAGTGKTHTLVTQYLHLCAGLTAHPKPLEPSQIVVLTFTEKAAAELQDRLHERTKALLAMAQREAAYISLVEEFEPALYHTAQEQDRPLPSLSRWESIMWQLETATVGTFHSFATTLLRRYAGQAGVEPGFQLLTPSDAWELQASEIKRILLLALEGNFEQTNTHLFVKEAEELVLEYGFAGFQEMEALAELLAKLVAQMSEEGKTVQEILLKYGMLDCSHEWQIICQSFLDKVQQLLAMKSQLGKASETLLEDMAQSYQQFWAWFEGRPSLEALLTEKEQILTTFDRYLENLANFRSQRDESSQKSLALVKESFRLLRREMDALLTTIEAAPLADAFKRLCCLAKEAYQSAKMRRNVLDFTDLLVKARDLLRDHSEVRRQIQSQVGAILLDEFQDTSPLQAEIISLLAFEPQPSSTSELGLFEAEMRDCGRICLVGDRKQSIYQFRGANVATFLTLCQDLAASGGFQDTLQHSRRSVAALLSFSNTFFAKIFQTAQENEHAHFYKNLAPHFAKKATPLWEVVWDPALDPLLPFREEEGTSSAVELLSATEGWPNEYDEPMKREATLIAKRVRSLLDEGRSCSDIAILFRRFTHLETYLLALSKEGIPVQVINGRGFYRAREVSDLISALMLIAEPEDRLALISVLRSPFIGLRDEHLAWLHRQKLLSFSGFVTIKEGDLPNLSLEEYEHFHRMGCLLSDLTQCAEQIGPSASLRKICEVSDYCSILAALPQAQQRLANVQQFIQIAQDSEFRGELFREFVATISNRMRMDPGLEGTPPAPIFQAENQAVQVMTIHQAKGLEFPVVMVAGCAGYDLLETSRVQYEANIGLGLTLQKEGARRETLPSLKIAALKRRQQEAESLRLLYVAVTRAKDQIIFAGEGIFRKKTWRSYLEEFLQSKEGHQVKTVSIPVL